MDYRHEVKHQITQADAVSIRNNLSAVAGSDPHVRSDGSYTIRSLYFDDMRNTALWEKLDGVNERRKFRIRYYNDDLSFIMLECKQKRDNVGCKIQERLTQDEVRRIMEGDISWMAAGDAVRSATVVLRNGLLLVLRRFHAFGYVLPRRKHVRHGYAIRQHAFRKHAFRQYAIG